MKKPKTPSVQKNEPFSAPNFDNGGKGGGGGEGKDGRVDAFLFLPGVGHYDWKGSCPEIGPGAREYDTKKMNIKGRGKG